MNVEIRGVIVSNDDAWIYQWFGCEATSPADVRTALTDRQSGETVDVYINSPGGDIYAGSEIYSILSSIEDVRIHITSTAFSAASVIACAGHSDIAPTAMMMIHNVSSSAHGDYRDLNKQAEILRIANRSIAAAYRAKTGLSETELLELMNTETWMTAEDAVEKGFVDEIAYPKGQATVPKLAASMCGMIPPQIINDMRSKKTESEAIKNQIKTLMMEEKK